MLQFHLMSAHIMGKRQESSLRYLPSVNYGLSRNQSAEHIERAVNYYDNGVVQTDAVIHDLLATLKAKNYLDHSLVVITGDHGESLGEHGLFAHANSVREEALRVPLILLSYGYVPAPLPEHVPTASQVDIAPTMLAELGFVRPRTWTGMALQNFAGREFSYFQEGNDVGLIHNRDPQNLWKFWMNMKTQRQYAFNLSEDPHERHNAVDSLPAEYLKTLRLQRMQLRSVGMAPQ